MKLYYQDDAVTIYHGNCLSILPLLQQKVDSVITDPPYGLGELQGTTSKQRNKNSYLSYDDTEENILTQVIPAISQALELAKGRGLIACGCRCLQLYPRARSIGGFYHPAAVGRTPWGFAGFSPVLFYGKDPRDGKGQSSIMTTITDRPSCSGHPCAKPMKAMLWMVGKGSMVGETILDPFMGSGTTLRAAKDLGRKAVGIEIEEKYCEIAANRMSQEVFDLGDLE